MIRAVNLSFQYPGQGPGEVALSGLDFAVEPGCLVCVLGGNGSGKSTLLALLAGLFSDFTGSLQVGGLDLSTAAPEARKLAGLVPQNPDLYLLGSTLQEDMLLGFSRVERDDAALLARAEALAREFGLAGLEQRPLQTLSFGQRRKASLAAALMREPRLLLLDEPFSGLDFEAQLHLRRIIQESRRQGLTQLVVAHDLDLIADLADGFLLLKGGRIIGQGDREEVFPQLQGANVRPPCWWLAGQAGPQFL